MDNVKNNIQLKVFIRHLYILKKKLYNRNMSYRLNAVYLYFTILNNKIFLNIFSIGLYVWKKTKYPKCYTIIIIKFIYLFIYI